jgi:hypothetical protein
MLARAVRAITPKPVLQVVCHETSEEDPPPPAGSETCFKTLVTIRLPDRLNAPARQFGRAVCSSFGVISRIPCVALAAASFVLVTNGCRATGGSQEAPEPTAPTVQAPWGASANSARTETDLDRTIRVQLDKSFADEPSLKDRDISFSVDGGDVTLTGTVRSETARRKANEVAMNVPGVRSVANALRVSL